MRPRNATCGHDAVISGVHYGGQCGEQDPLQNAQQSINEGDRRGIEVGPAHPPHAQQRGKIEQPGDRRQHHHRQDRLGRFSSSPVRNSRHNASVIDAKTSARGVRSPSSFTRIWRYFRHRIALSQRGKEVRGADAEELLSRIERIAVLGRKGAGGGDTLHIGVSSRHPTASGLTPLDVAQAQARGPPGWAGLLGYFSSGWHPECGSPSRVAAGIARAMTASAHRRPGKQPLAEQQQATATTPTASRR